MITRLRQSWIFIAIFVAAFMLRLFLSPLAVHGDLLSQAGWGWWIYHHGMLGFYDNNVWIYGWPSHPPLISAVYAAGFLLHQWMNSGLVFLTTFIALHHLGAHHLLWFFRFTDWFGNAFYPAIPYKIGELIGIKLFPIVADLFVGFVIYNLVAGHIKQKAGLIFLLLYLFLPFSWYESALWGQTDQLSFLVLLGAIYLLYRKKPHFGMPLFAISIGLKPTTLVFLPLIIVFLWQVRQYIAKIIIGLGLSSAIYLVVWRLFSHRTLFVFSNQIISAIFNKGEILLWYNSFNFWHIITKQFTPVDTKFLFFSLGTWGWLIALAFVGIALISTKFNDWYDILFCIFVIAFATFLFLPKMHERYLFPAIVTGLILSSMNRKFFYQWLLLTIIFSINLYSEWWFPTALQPFRQFLEWQHGLIRVFLSGGNLILFFTMINTIKPWSGLITETRKRLSHFRSKTTMPRP